jgi:hypothetical protein
MRCISGKVCHCNRKRAIKAKANLESRKGWDGMKIDVYHCKECDMWHAGHSGDSLEVRLAWKRLETLVAEG